MQNTERVVGLLTVLGLGGYVVYKKFWEKEGTEPPPDGEEGEFWKNITRKFGYFYGEKWYKRKDGTTFLMYIYNIRLYRFVCKPDNCYVEGRAWLEIGGEKAPDAQVPFKVYQSIDYGDFIELPDVAIADGYGYIRFSSFEYPGDGRRICLRFHNTVEPEVVYAPTVTDLTPFDWFWTPYYLEAEDP